MPAFTSQHSRCICHKDTDKQSGKLFLITPEGSATQLLLLEQEMADVGIIQDQK